MRAEPTNLGFVIADGEEVELAYHGDTLVLRFVDWTEQRVTVDFREAVGVRWQRADSTLLPDEQWDGANVVHESPWLKEHFRQNESTGDHRHLKLNFNAAGCLEVLCCQVVRRDTPA